MDGGDGDVGGADVDDEGGGFAGREGGEHPVAGEVEGRGAPALHGDFDGALAVLARVPAGFGHEEGVFADGFFLLGRVFHLDVLVFGIVEAVGGQFALPVAGQFGCDGVFPEAGGGVPVPHRAVLGHDIVDGYLRRWCVYRIVAKDVLLRRGAGVE